MSQPVRYTMKAYQGQTWEETITVNDSDGNPVDLTGYEARMQVREDYASESVILELTADNGRITIPTPTDGTVVISVDAADMAGLDLSYEPQAYIYDIEIFKTDGYVQRIVEGAVIFFPEVTRT